MPARDPAHDEEPEPDAPRRVARPEGIEEGGDEVLGDGGAAVRHLEPDGGRLEDWVARSESYVAGAREDAAFALG